MERTVTEQQTTMKRQKLRDHNKENSAFGELGNSPEGKYWEGVESYNKTKSLHATFKSNIC